MSNTIHKDFINLPDKLQTWGMTAISQIPSPEKKSQAAHALRHQMDSLMIQCQSENFEEKVNYVLEHLGDANVYAQKLLKESLVEPNSRKKDIIAGIIFLTIGVLSCLYSFSVLLGPYAFFAPGWYDYAINASGKNAGAGAFAGILLLIIGIRLLII